MASRRDAAARWPLGHAVVRALMLPLVVAIALAVSVGGARASYADDDPLFRIRSAEVTESSSLVISTTYAHLAYTTNDSGDGPVVYAVDPRSGRVVGHTTLDGVDAYDVEALGGGSDGSLVVADIGDNSGVRERVSFHRIDQPARGDHVVAADTVSLRYADGPRDAESVLYDSDSGRIFVVSKEFGDAHVYRSGKNAFARPFGVLRPVAAAPPLATDATYLPDRSLVVVRGYVEATVLRAAGWQRIARFDLPAQEQGESIAAPLSGDVVWVGSEGTDSPVHVVALPAVPTAPTAPGGASPGGPTRDVTSPGADQTHAPAPENAATDDAARETARRFATWVGGGALGALLVVLGLLLLRSRRSRHV